MLKNLPSARTKILNICPVVSCSSTSTSQVIPSNCDEERIKLQKWIEMCKFEGDYLPKVITDEQFESLLSKSSFQRKKYLFYLAKKEYAGVKDKRKKEQQKIEKNVEKEERLALNTETHIRYGLWYNSLFAKTTDRNIANLYDHHLANAMMYGQNIVLDLGFENHMVGREISSLAEQIVQMISVNRVDSEPFNLTLCNVDFNCESTKELRKRMPNIFADSFPLQMTEKSYMDLYPTDKLVYLSPNARNVLTELDPDAVYILGGIVDLGRKEPLTLAKAKKQKIKMAKLPLDRFHVFKHDKNLSIHVVMKILLDLQRTGNWQSALENIPKRFISTSDETKTSYWDQKKSYRH